MQNLIKLFFLILIIGCGSDAGSSIASSNEEENSNNGSGNSNGGTVGNITVELISNYNDNTATYSTVFGNYTRNFIVHTPSNYDSDSEPVPLVFVLHGYTGQAPSIRNYSGFDNIADEENFIVVYVQGTTDITGSTGWNVNVSATFNEVDDVGLFAALIKYFKGTYNVDSTKIFSTGMSLGGFMSYKLACELEEINGIGSVTGSMSQYYNCTPPGEKNIIHFHGTSDTVVPYNGNSWSRNVKDLQSLWANHNECQNETEITIPDFNGDGVVSTQLTSYDCNGNKQVVLYTLQNEGHTWFDRSRGDDVNASELIWEFFKDK